MKKMNQEIFELLSDPQAYDTTLELIDSFEMFKSKLILNFISAVADKLKEKVKSNEWEVSLNTENFDKKHEFEITIKYINDIDKGLAFTIINDFGSISYGIYYDSESKCVKNPETLFKDTEFIREKDNEWKFIDKTFKWPLFYSEKGVNLRDNHSLKDLLPLNLDTTVSEYIEAVTFSFNSDVQNFIKSHIKLL